MVSPEEVAAWSLEELRAETLNILPSGWVLVPDHNPLGYWEIRLQSVDAEGKQVVELEVSNADQKLALLDVFGWLWFRSAPPPSVDSPWVRRHDPALPIARQAVIKGSHVADPEDLDPAEIALVHKSRK